MRWQMQSGMRRNKETLTGFPVQTVIYQCHVVQGCSVVICHCWFQESEKEQEEKENEKEEEEEEQNGEGEVERGEGEEGGDEQTDTCVPVKAYTTLSMCTVQASCMVYLWYQNDGVYRYFMVLYNERH